jgi:hypothetical protein
MKDWLLAVLGTVIAFMVIICAVRYQSPGETPVPAEVAYGADRFNPTGFGGPRGPSEQQQRLGALAEQVASHERCFIAGNLLPGQRLDDQPLRAIYIANNAHFSVEERGRQLVELDQAMTIRRAEPLIERGMSGR